MLEEKKLLIAARLKKSIDGSVLLLNEINECMERIIIKNQQIVKLTRTYKTWHDKVKKTN